MADPPLPQVRLLNFISAQQTEDNDDNAKGSRVKDASSSASANDRPLFEILRENKEKQQSEFNERFKHRPPKALDEDETEFLEQVETYRKEQEKKVAAEEARELLNFQAAIANRTIQAGPEASAANPQEVKQEAKQLSRPSTERRPFQGKGTTSFIKIKPQPKKAKIEEVEANLTQQQHLCNKHAPTDKGFLDSSHPSPKEQLKPEKATALQGLVAYASDEDSE